VLNSAAKIAFNLKLSGWLFGRNIFIFLHAELKNNMNNEIQDVISGKSQVGYGTNIQAAINYLRAREKTGALDKADKHFKREETESLKIISLICYCIIISFPIPLINYLDSLRMRISYML